MMFAYSPGAEDTVEGRSSSHLSGLTLGQCCHFESGTSCRPEFITILSPYPLHAIHNRQRDDKSVPFLDPIEQKSKVSWYLRRVGLLTQCNPLNSHPLEHTASLLERYHRRKPLGRHFPPMGSNAGSP